MVAAYFDQFNIVRLMTLQVFSGEWLITFTNSTLMMLMVLIIFGLFSRGNALIPGR